MCELEFPSISYACEMGATLDRSATEVVEGAHVVHSCTNNAIPEFGSCPYQVCSSTDATFISGGMVRENGASRACGGEGSGWKLRARRRNGFR
jgi:hypothetical protein